MGACHSSRLQRELTKSLLQPTLPSFMAIDPGSQVAQARGNRRE